MKFFKTFLASILGTLVALILIFLFFFIFLASSADQPEPYIRSNTVLKIDMSGNIPMKAPYDPFAELFDPNFGSKVSVQTLQQNLEKAAAHENVSGVWVEINNISSSWAYLETMREDFEQFRESGKFLYFSSDDIGMNEPAYFLATTADSIFHPPESGFSFDGFVAQLTFYRDLLDKIGVEPEMLRTGPYKSAIEPYMRNSATPEYRMQIQELLDSYSSTFVEAVTQRSGHSIEEVNEMLNSPPVDRVRFAFENGLIDSVAYPDQVKDMIRARIGLEEDEEITTVSFSRYNRVSRESAGLDDEESSDKIAVIFSSGTILPDLGDNPFGGDAGITPESLKESLDDAVEDEDIKAIVLHINSPGGAATSSDLLWRYVKEASDKKPVVASMGSVAASGGYYMAMGADTVLANPNTVTGSIGVAQLLFNVEELTSEKLGINYETLKTHEYADLFDLTDDFTQQEMSVFEQSIQENYEDFLQVVAENRGMTRDQVHELAQGRVYTGDAALEVGLIDILGNYEDAIRIAAEMAEIEAYDLESYPKRKDLFQELMGSSSAQMSKLATSWIPEFLRGPASDAHTIFSTPSVEQWYIMPYRIELK